MNEFEEIEYKLPKFDLPVEMNVSPLAKMLIDSAVELLKMPAYTRQTMIIDMSKEELEYFIQKGYIRLDGFGKPKLINKQGLISEVKKEHGVK